MGANFPPPQCVDEIMEDMPESDLLPKNVMKVPEVFLTVLSIIIREGDGEGEEEGRGRGDKGEEEGGRGREEEEVHMLYCHNVSLSMYIVM